MPLDSTDLGSTPADARVMLDQAFAADIRRMAALTGLDLADWLRPDHREPMPTG